MIKHINELKNKVIEKANYYSNIGFVNLAEEFTSVVKILNEMEAVVRERDELKQEKEEKIKMAIELHDSEECD